MAKRFTETEKWKDKWFRGLSSKHKLAYLYLLDNCDHAGVIELDEELADFQIGEPIDWNAFLEAGQNRIVRTSGGKLYIAKFIEYQYGKLSKDCKAHNPVFASLEKHNLLKGYLKGIQRVQDKDKDKDKDKDNDKDSLESQVLERWNTLMGCRMMMTDSRKASLNARSQSAFWVENWEVAIERVAKSDFCKGKNDRGWKADLDFFLKPDSVVKILEGKYDNRTGLSDGLDDIPNAEDL